MAGDLPALPSIALGHYRHYKGGEYEVIGVVRHSETLEPMVLYRPLDRETGAWVRPFAMFLEPVEHDGSVQPRFRRITETAGASEAELAATVQRMEARLDASATARGLMTHYRRLAERFEHDLGGSRRDVELAKASALMLVQAAAAG